MHYFTIIWHAKHLFKLSLLLPAYDLAHKQKPKEAIIVEQSCVNKASLTNW